MMRNRNDPWRVVRAEERRQRGYTEDQWRTRNETWQDLQAAEATFAAVEFDGASARRLTLRRQLDAAWERYNAGTE